MKKKTSLLRMIAISMALITSVFLYAKMRHFPFPVDTKDSSHTTTEEPVAYEYLYNAKALAPFFEKLNALDTLKDRKLNIVHIGDSHIQGNAMTGELRQQFQSQFGNGGLGFVFPYSLIGTNGERYVRFSSNITWDSQKNTSRENINSIGIGGYSLLTNNKNFVIELNLKDKDYSFNTLRILTPNNQHLFDLATSKNGGSLKPMPSAKRVAYKTHTHKVQKGETLYSLSKKYKTTEIPSA